MCIITGKMKTGASTRPVRYPDIRPVLPDNKRLEPAPNLLGQYRLFNTSLRIRAAVVYEKKLNANYFGVGSKTTHDNLEDSNLTTHKTWKHYYKRFLKDDYLFFTQGYWWHFISYKYDNYMYIEPRVI